MKRRFGLQKILRKEGIHHSIGRIQLTANLLEEIEPAAECLSGVVRLHTSRLVEEGRAAPVLREFGEINHEVLPTSGRRSHGTEREHRLIENP